MPLGTDMAKINWGIPWPSMDMRISRISMDGIHSQASTKRCTIRSNQPPMTADRVPMSRDTRVEITAQHTHRITDVRAP